MAPTPNHPLLTRAAAAGPLTPGQITRFNQASTLTAPYPHFPYQRQEGFARLNPAA